LSRDDADWLMAERLAPYIYQRLQRLGLTPLMPAPVLSDLHLEYVRSAAQNLLIATELQELLTDLRRAGVEPIVLKGMALGTTIYPALATRPMNDLDLLVRPDELTAVQQVFAARRYQDMGLGRDEQTGFPAHLHAWREYPGGQRIAIEAHWHLFHESAYRQIDLTSWRERTRTVAGEGYEIRVLAPDDELIYACAHLVLHHVYNWNLLWLLDVRMLLEHYGAVWSWAAVAERAHAVQMAGLVDYVLGLCQRWLGDCVTIADRERLRGRLSPEEEHYLKLTHNLAPTVLQVNLQRARGLGWWRRWQTYAEFLFPPWTYMQYRYQAGSRWAAPYYYGKRLVRGAVVAFKRFN
jgi:hypothetical protein